jgi:Domain of unknown function (DUF4158)
MNAMLLDYSEGSQLHFGLEGSAKLVNAYPNRPVLLGHWGTVDAPDFTPFNGNPARLVALAKNPGRIHALALGQPYTARLYRLEKKTTLRAATSTKALFKGGLGYADRVCPRPNSLRKLKEIVYRPLTICFGGGRWSGTGGYPKRTGIASKRDAVSPTGWASRCSFVYFAIQAGHWGRATPPQNLLKFVAEQLSVDAAEVAEYSRRPQTRTDHAQELAQLYRFRQYSSPVPALLREQIRAEAIGNESAYTPVEGALEWLRSQRVIVPALTTLESLVRSVRSEVERHIYDRIEKELTGDQKKTLDGLLEVSPKRGSMLGWLRRVPSSCSAAGIQDLLRPDSCGHHPQALGRGGPVCHFDPAWFRERLTLDRQASRLSPPDTPGVCPARNRPDRTVAVYLGLAPRSGTPASCDHRAE